MSEGEGQRERERASQAGSTLGEKPDTRLDSGLDPTTLGL